MKCECGNEIHDPTEEPSFKVKEIGKSYNYEFGLDDYWFVGELKCPSCDKIIEFSDSSL